MVKGDKDKVEIEGNVFGIITEMAKKKALNFMGYYLWNKEE